jgi:hypothetical protein
MKLHGNFKRMIKEQFEVFDIETISEDLILDRIGIYSNRYNEVFESYEDFFKFIMKYKIETLFAFYGGGFDFLLLLNYIRDNNSDFKVVHLIEVASIFIYLKIESKGIEFEFYDAFAIFRGFSLNEVAKNLLGKEKLNLDRTRLQDYTIAERNAYVIQDCILLFECLLKFRELVGFLEITISRIALLNFTNDFCQHKLVKYPLNFISLIEPFYFGGHVDVYKRYGENLNYYDINSCYGYAMKEYGAIYNYIGYTSKQADSETIKGLYNITVDKNNELYAPVLPKKYTDKYSKLYFLNCYDSQFQVTSKDLQLLDELNINYKVHNGFLFDYDRNFFKDYVEYWYKKRQESKELKFIAKLMINALYGKFGQKVKRTSTVIGEDLEYYYDEVLRIGRKETMSINWFSHTEIAAWVTSCSRYIHSHLIQDNQEHVYYVDTDSIIVDNEIVTGTNIGELKLEQSIKRGYFIGNKFYGLFNENDSKIVIKGYEKSENVTEQNFKDAISNNDFLIEYQKSKIQKFKRSLISADTYIKILDVEKKITDVSIKRKLLNNKIDTEPYQLINNQLY